MSYSNRRIAIVMVAALAISVSAATPAFADEVAAAVGDARSESLPIVATADQVAGASAAAQAAAGDVFHAELSGLLGTCSAVGEVVGAGPNISVVFSAFQQSASHWNIITGPTWTAMGTGQATGSNGVTYVSAVFCQLATDTGPPDPPPDEADPISEDPLPAPSAPQSISPEPAPVKDEPSARRDGMTRWEAETELPAWYIAKCGPEEGGRVLKSGSAEEEACPS